MDRKTTGLLMVVAVATMQALATEVYTWVDEQGVAHYSQFKPRSIEAEKLHYREGESKGLAEEMQNPRYEWLEKTRQERLEKQQQQNEKAQADTTFSQFCESLKKNLDVLGRGGQVREQTSDGEFRVLPEEERQAKLSEAQAQFDKHCS